MKIKTNELTGAALDWAVGKILGLDDETLDPITWIETAHPTRCYDYSTDWAHGGPIIEREGIATREIPPVSGGNGYIFTRRWIAEMFLFPGGPRRAVAYGTTPLVAAMRCYVAPKLGDEVDVPEELT